MPAAPQGGQQPPAPGSPEPLATAAQVAAFCQVSPGTVRNWVRAGRLPALRLSEHTGHLRFRWSDVRALLHPADQK